ncbi:ABC transporter permease [Breznakiella homolactica]|uniref:ABC transporter permease n=1 Tax=Breznakiella homolactica TaxID=2798577 RepID=A0A7T7XNJ3_9SPIR|nr:ABC transporter permease [Breznakiella homolactica]QQO09522.1 ABC transporter permease [Breznakiella homolactica]
MSKQKNPRPREPRQAAYGSVITLVCATLVAVILIAVNSASPAASLKAFFAGPWSSPWFSGNTLDSIALLLTASLGIALAFRGGTFNLGGEGQIYIGGLAASALLLSGETFPGWTMLIFAAIAAMAVGGAMGAVSGLLKRRFGANELITTFLLSSALTPAADYLITGPLRDPSGNLLATPRFAADRILPHILPPSSLSVSCIIAAVLVIGGHIFIAGTGPGYRFRIAGAAPEFARYGGIAAERYWTPALFFSGLFHGLAGFFAVAGTYGMGHLGFPGGLGWNAIAVALIARNHPLALFPAALIYGWLKAGSDAALLATGLGFEAASFIQAAVLILATVRFAGFPRLRLRRVRP